MQKAQINLSRNDKVVEIVDSPLSSQKKILSQIVPGDEDEDDQMKKSEIRPVKEYLSARKKVAHFEALKQRGGVYQVWLFEDSQGRKKIQHHQVDGTFKVYELNSVSYHEEGTWQMDNSSYSYSNKYESQKFRGTLLGDADNFYLDFTVDANFRKMKLIPTSETYHYGCKVDFEDKDSLPIIHSVKNLRTSKPDSYEDTGVQTQKIDFLPTEITANITWLFFTESGIQDDINAQLTIVLLRNGIEVDRMEMFHLYKDTGAKWFKKQLILTAENCSLISQAILGDTFKVMYVLNTAENESDYIGLLIRDLEIRFQIKEDLRLGIQEKFPTITDENAGEIIQALTNYKNQESNHYQRLISNLSMNYILDTMQLSKQNTKALFEIFIDDQTSKLDYKTGAIQYSSNYSISAFHFLFSAKLPQESFVMKIDNYDQLSKTEIIDDSLYSAQYFCCWKVKEKPQFQKQYIQDNLFIDQTGPQFELNVILIKLFTRLGSKESFELISQLLAIIATRPYLYDSEIIQKIILIKEQQLKPWAYFSLVKWMIFVAITIFCNISKQIGWFIGILIVQVNFEAYQIYMNIKNRTQKQNVLKTFPKAFFSIFDLFQNIDIACIITLIKIIDDYRTNQLENKTLHAILVILALMSGLQQFSLFKNCRRSIFMIIGCLYSIGYFTLIYAYFIVSFAFFFKFLKDNDSLETPENNFLQNFMVEMKNVSTWVTGGFEFEDEQDRQQQIGQVLVIFLITIFMTNMLVGILSEKLGELINNRIRSDYELLLQIVIDQEIARQLVLSPFKLCQKCTKNEIKEEYIGEHLVYAKMVEESDDWEGQIKATRDLIKESEQRVIAKNEIIQAESENRIMVQINSLKEFLSKK